MGIGDRVSKKVLLTPLHCSYIHVTLVSGEGDLSRCDDILIRRLTGIA